MATTVLGQDIINQLSGFVDQKIDGFRALDVSLTQQLASNEKQIEIAQAALKAAGNLSPLEQLVLQGNVNNAIQQQGHSCRRRRSNRQQLSQAENVEKPQFVDRPVPTRRPPAARATRCSSAARSG